jgi:hypothetical protein
MWMSVSPWPEEYDKVRWERMVADKAAGRGLHSSTFRLNLSAFC